MEVGTNEQRTSDGSSFVILCIGLFSYFLIVSRSPFTANVCLLSPHSQNRKRSEEPTLQDTYIYIYIYIYVCVCVCVCVCVRGGIMRLPEHLTPTSTLNGLHVEMVTKQERSRSA